MAKAIFKRVCFYTLEAPHNRACDGITRNIDYGLFNEY